MLLKAVFLPVTLFFDVVEKIRDQAYDELYGEENIKRDLLRLQLRLEMGEISEEEYNKAEKILLDRLDVALAAREV